jgi:NADP-dependent 3-hydroxy acid dehydrogenase YdfG
MSETAGRDDEAEHAGGPVVVITGGLSGIGAAVAREFAALGARLVLCDRSLERGETVLGPLRAGRADAVAIAADVREPAAMEALAAAAVERHGRIDVLVANAGVADQSAVADGDPDRWRTVVETNLLGTMFSARAVLPAMIGAGGGHVFIVSSVSGREAYAGEAVYIASKWGQIGFAHALRVEVRDHGIRVSVVEPGIVDTPLTRDNPVVRPLLEASQPLAPEDVARAIAYAYAQPPHVVLSELTIRPLRQRVGDLEHARVGKPAA